jgi:hypothetical protein
MLIRRRTIMEFSLNHKVRRLFVLMLAALLAACNLPRPQPTALSTANPTSDQPVIILYPNEGGAGTQVTLTGAGFPANMNLEVHIGIPNAGFGEQAYAKTTSDTKGNVSLNFSMPGQWPDGAPIHDSKLIVVLSNPDGSVKGLAPFNFVPAVETEAAATGEAPSIEGSPTAETAGAEETSAPAATLEATSTPHAGTTAVIPLIPQPVENSTQAPVAASANVYRPISREECAAMVDAMGQNLEISGAFTEEPFKDAITNESGTGCQVTITGSGMQFKSFVEIANGLKKMLANQGWAEDDQYLADGPTGTAAAFRKGSDLALLSVGWKPSADANCPPDQPISACPLKPEQQIYTISLNVARK